MKLLLWLTETPNRIIWTNRFWALVNTCLLVWNLLDWKGWLTAGLVLVNVAGIGLSVWAELRWENVIRDRAKVVIRRKYMRWFGKHWGAAICSEIPHTNTPVGEPCFWCGEVILATDDGFMVPHLEGDLAVLRPEHVECQIRSIVGGLNHQLNRCTCCGGTEPPDPADMSRRDAAKAAAAYASRPRQYTMPDTERTEK